MEQKQLEELCRRAAQRSQPLFSRFLDLDGQKQAVIAANASGAEYTLFGGAEGCERQMLGAGLDAPEKELFPISCLRVVPRSLKFSQPLTHRDVLGTLMGLGIERELIGDIVIREDGAYVFCVNAMADFLKDSLTRVGRTDTDCDFSAPPEGPLRQTRQQRIQVSSLRTDAVCAHLFKLSRGDTQALIRQGKISVDDRLCVKCDQLLTEGQVLSVRGHGRAMVRAVEGLTRKGKLNVVIDVYA